MNNKTGSNNHEVRLIFSQFRMQKYNGHLSSARSLQMDGTTPVAIHFIYVHTVANFSFVGILFSDLQ